MERLAPALPPAEAGFLRKLLAVGIVALALGVAGGWVLHEREEDEDSASISGWNTCTNAVAGFSISYPSGWYTDHPRPEFACTYFDPRPFELAGHGNWGPTALQVIAELEDAAAGRFERTTGEGMQQYGYVIEEAGRRFSIFTTSNQGVDYSS